MLSLNEIRSRALAFSREYADEFSEDAEAKSFWDDFFNVFGISRRRVATFEEAVKKGDSKQGFIDLLWKGTILVEHKSRGKDLDKAFQQAKDYFPGLKEHELPKYILISDFENFDNFSSVVIPRFSSARRAGADITLRKFSLRFLFEFFISISSWEIY